MTNLLTLFANNILPIFLAAGAGYVLSKTFKLDPKPVSQVAFYILTPCLIFNLLTTSSLSSDEVGQVIAIAILSILAVGMLAWVAGKALRFDRRLLVAALLVTMFGNTGNFGLSLNLFAFGESSLAYASLYFVTGTVLVSTLGVFLATLGSSSLKTALVGLARVPVLYAVVVAMGFNYLGWKLPLPVDRSVSLLGSATIPILILLMGIQLEKMQWDHRFLALGSANAIRLLASPAITYGLILLFGLGGSASQAVMAQSGTPTMVMTSLLAVEYEVEPSFVTAAIFTSTLLSPLTMTPLLAWLGA